MDNRKIALIGGGKSGRLLAKALAMSVQASTVRIHEFNKAMLGLADVMCKHKVQISSFHIDEIERMGDRSFLKEHEKRISSKQHHNSHYKYHR